MNIYRLFFKKLRRYTVTKKFHFKVILLQSHFPKIVTKFN